MILLSFQIIPGHGESDGSVKRFFLSVEIVPRVNLNEIICNNQQNDTMSTFSASHSTKSIANTTVPS